MIWCFFLQVHVYFKCDEQIRQGIETLNTDIMFPLSQILYSLLSVRGIHS